MSSKTQFAIAQICDEIKEMLIEKNKSYGDSALNPVRIFAKSDSVEQLHVRIDDKLSRITRGGSYVGDNDLNDLIGYLILLKMVKSRKIPTKYKMVQDEINPISNVLKSNLYINPRIIKTAIENMKISKYMLTGDLISKLINSINTEYYDKLSYEEKKWITWLNKNWEWPDVNKDPFDRFDYQDYLDTLRDSGEWERY